MNIRIFALFFVFLGIFSSFNLNAHENGCNCLSETENSTFLGQIEDKIYVNPQAIIIYENQFYLNVSNNLMPVSGFFSDPAGIYMSVKKESEKGWTCPICGYYNPPEAMICINSNKHWIYEPEYR